MELLEEYHASLGHTDSDLRRELERIITVFKRELFQSLLGEYSGILTFLGEKFQYLDLYQGRGILLISIADRL